MQLIDVNVLVNAFRKDAPFHLPSHAWIEQVFRSQVPFGFNETIAVGFLRNVTNHKIYVDPDSIEEASAGLKDITARREFTWLNAGHDHWSIFRRLTEGKGIKGNLVNDAWLAALAIEGNYELITLDNDFKRFPGLIWRNLRDGI